MLSTFRKTIAVIVLNGAFVKRGADDSVESTGVFIGHKKTATEVAVFYNWKLCFLLDTRNEPVLGRTRRFYKVPNFSKRLR